VAPAFVVLLVTPEGVAREDLAAALERGARVLGPRLAVQARSKEGPAALARIVQDARDVARALGLPWFVNGDADAAIREGAHLHVPGGAPWAGLRERMKGAWLSAPAHHDADVRAAAAAGFDAVLVSPIFEVPGKGPPRGTEALRAARALAPRIHLVALGGVDAARAGACLEAGADAVAVMRAPFVDHDFFKRIEGLVGPLDAST